MSGTSSERTAIPRSHSASTSGAGAGGAGGSAQAAGSARATSQGLMGPTAGSRGPPRRAR